MSVRVEMKPGAARELRYSAGARTICETYGRAVTHFANSTLRGRKGYEMRSQPGARKPFGRWRVSVTAVSPYARRSNARHQTLIKVLSAR